MRFSLLSRQTRRDYAGFAPGKRRKMAVVPFIADDIAGLLLRGLRFSTRQGSVDAAQIAAVIATCMTAFPEDAAFRLVDGDHEGREAAHDDLCRNICIALLDAFDITPVEKACQAAIPPAQEHNGWLEWQRVSPEEKPKYRWRRAWPDHVDDDFAGFDGPCLLGRIFRIDHIQQRQKWFWLLGYLHRPDGTPLNRTTPISGWEDTPRQAACRVEQCYEATLKTNRNRRTP